MNETSGYFNNFSEELIKKSTINFFHKCLLFFIKKQKDCSEGFVISYKIFRGRIYLLKQEPILTHNGEFIKPQYPEGTIESPLPSDQNIKARVKLMNLNKTSDK